MTNGKLALVIGAAGGVGFETARALSRHGWRVRALARRAPTDSAGLEWVRGDAMNAADVREAAEGASLIVHAVNPPGYKNWRGLALPMLDNSIAVAEAVGARIVFPGTVYNYGPDAFPVIDEAAPQRPHTRKGAIRVEMERRLQASSARVLILRGGDFFGPRAGNSWFSQGLVKPGAVLKAVTYPGKHAVGHAWAYLPDFAETIGRLVDRDAQLGKFERFHFGGHWFARGVEMAERIRRVAGDESLPIRGFPWAVLLALSPFVRLFGEMAEMRYLWTDAVQLDNAKLTAFLGAEPHTPIDAALGASLEGLGCLPEDAVSGAYQAVA